jgi:hypothetical protein
MFYDVTVKNDNSNFIPCLDFQTGWNNFTSLKLEK